MNLIEHKILGYYKVSQEICPKCGGTTFLASFWTYKRFCENCGQMIGFTEKKVSE